MVTLQYNGPFPSVRIEPSGSAPIEINRGESAEVPDEVADELVARSSESWEIVV